MDSYLEEYVVETIKRLEKPGLLLVSSNMEGKSNVMTIGWGLIGTFWSMPVFMIAVRPSRYTHGFIEERSEFTVNVPKDGMDEIVEYCGTVSGRKHDKFKECKLTLSKAKEANVPIMKECQIHYECQVVHKIKVIPELIPSNVKETLYPKDNYHTLYFGKILAVH